MNRAELVKTLEFVSQALPRNATAASEIPILGCFCFDNGLVYATDDALCIRAACSVEGSFAVHGPTLLKLLQAYTSVEVDLSRSGATSEVLVNGGHSKSRLPTFPKEDFIFETPPENGVTIPLDESLKKGLVTCISTVSTDLTKMPLLGISLIQDCMYSSDGDALTRYRGNWKFTPVMLPANLCQVLFTLPKNGVLSLTEEWAIATSGDIKIYGKVMSHSVFDFERVINETIKGSPEFVEVTPELKAALIRARVIADVGNTPTHLQVRRKELEVNTFTDLLGLVSDVVPFNHSDIKVNVAAYLMQRACSLCKHVAIFPNCTVYTDGEDVIQIISNLED